jgi:hypothetical protein
MSTEEWILHSKILVALEAICTLHPMDGAVLHLEETPIATPDKLSYDSSQLRRVGSSQPYSHRNKTILESNTL